jgi:hypothetical protein
VRIFRFDSRTTIAVIAQLSFVLITSRNLWPVSKEVVDCAELLLSISRSMAVM